MNRAVEGSTIRTLILVLAGVLLCQLVGGNATISMTLAADDDYTELDPIPVDEVRFERKGIVPVQAVRLQQPEIAVVFRKANVAVNAPAARVRVVVQVVGMNDFGPAGSLDARLKQLIDRVEQKARRILHEYELSPEDRERVRLASIADRMRESRLRDEYDRQTASTRDVLELERLGREVNERIRHAEMFAADSFFEKATQRIVEGKMRSLHSSRQNVASSDLLSKRHQANAESAVADLARRVKLADQQKVWLVRALLQQTQPPKVFGDFDDIVVKYRLGSLPRESIEAIFDEDQWPKVFEALEGFREFGPFLKRHKLLGETGDGPQRGAK